MQRILLKSKLHRATVTAAELHYVGSITIDADLMEAADMVEYEQVQIYNITNGARFTTYTLRGPAGSSCIQINGAAAHRASPGDLIIIASYANYEANEVAHHQPRVVLLSVDNRMHEFIREKVGVESALHEKS
jgi:aspartate 1-decarboxylase